MMEHCKKLVLVPHESLAKLHEKTVARTSSDVMSDLDQQMNRILKQKAEDSEKWKLYEQALQKYLYFVNEQKKPLSLMVPETDDTEKPQNEAPRDTKTREKLLTIIPQKFKTAASTLYDHLSTPEAKRFISWDANGTTSVGGETLPSIIDLISDAVRTRKTSKVTGWRTFVSALKSLHTPLEIIGNTKYLNALQSQEGAGVTINNGTPTEAEQKNNHTSKTFARHKIKTKKITDKQKKRSAHPKWRRWL